MAISILKEDRGESVPLVNIIHLTSLSTRSFIAYPGLKHQ